MTYSPLTPSSSNTNGVQILGYEYSGLANGLVDYAFKSLGAPILNIDVVEEQVNYLLGDAIQFYNDYTSNGHEKTFLAYQVTESDKARFTDGNRYSVVENTKYSNTPNPPETETKPTISEGQGIYKESQRFIVLPDWITGVNRVYGAGGSYIRNSLLGIQFQVFLSDIYNTGGIDLLSYYSVKSYLETLDFVLNTGKNVQYRYNPRVNKLYLDVEFSLLSENQWILIDCFKLVDPNEAPKMFNDIFLKRYFTALVKRQWGTNLMKYNQVQLPGGVLTNGPLIYEQAQAEINQLEEEVLNKYSFMPSILIG